MKLKKYLALFLLIPLFAFSVHKYYISLCEIEYVEKQQSIQITLGLFINDLEFTLNKEHNTSLNLATKKEIPTIDIYYKEYLKKHFSLIVNNKPQTFTFIGKEYDEDIVRFYLEINNIPKLESIEVSNTCLFKDFEDQQNIIKIKANNSNKTFYLNKNNLKDLLIY